MTLSWIENEIDKAVKGDNSPQNVYDLAALITVRDFLRASEKPTPKKEEKQETPEERRRREAVILTRHSADLDTIPTIEQIEEGIAVLAANTPEERQRKKDAITWTQIIQNSKKQ